MDQTLLNAKILIVDDQEANIDILTGLFEHQGYVNVMATTDPRTVLDRVTTFQPDLILLDLMMPYLSGYEVMDQLREVIPEDAYLPILVLTADISVEAKLLTLSAGAKDFLVKPFDVTEVGLRIKNLLLTRYLYLQLQSQNQTLTELNDLKSRFVSMASHEFKTPLSSILMSGETLSAYWKRMSEDQINKKIRTIIEQVDHLTNIVNDVMQLSKLQTGNTVVKMTRLDLVVICKEIIGEFNSNPKNKRTLEDLPPGLPFHSLSNQGPIEFFTEFESLEMRLDQRLILQVLNNLLSNAIKYSEGQPWVRVSLYKQPDELVLCVKDQGMGIPEVDFKHLFQPFFRAENVSQIEGNGLGLNIVRESVRLLGGEVTFSSKVGEGSTFYIHLPDSLLFLPG